MEEVEVPETAAPEAEVKLDSAEQAHGEEADAGDNDSEAPRRSARSTKGRNPRLEREILEEAKSKALAAKNAAKAPSKPTTKSPAKKPEAKKSPAKKPQTKKPEGKKQGAVKDEPEEDEEEDEEEGDDGVVNCVCGASFVADDDFRAMAECEKCLKWQHVECMMGVDDEDAVREGYYCHECDPAAYEQRVTSLKREAEEAASKGNKKRRKDSTVEQAMSFDDIPDKVRRSVAVALYEIFKTTVVPEAVANKALILSEGQTVDSFAQDLSLRIEQALYHHLATKPAPGTAKGKAASHDVGTKYREKFRSLSFNLKDDKNPDLRLRIATGELSPDAIVTLSSEEMLNPELQKLAETVRKESIRESVLKVDDAPRLRKTHKGEEFVGQEDDYAPDTPANRKANKREGSEGSEDADNDGDALERDDDRDLREETPDLARSGAHDGPVNVDVVAYSPPGSPGSPGYTGSPGSPTEDVTVDLDDDFDLGNIEREQESREAEQAKGEAKEQSKLQAKTQPQAAPRMAIWMGHVDMKGVAEFQGSAIHVCSDAPRFDPLQSWGEIIDLTGPLIIDGRLDRQRAVDYLRNVLGKKDFTAFALIPNGNNGPDTESYDKLFHYFYDKSKYGVIQTRGRRVKDAYIVGVGPYDELPEYLLATPEQVLLAQELKIKYGKLVLGVFVMHRNEGTPPVPQRPAYQPPVSVAQPSQNTLESMGFSSNDFQALQGVLAAHPEVARNPELPSNPQMLLELLQQTQNQPQYRGPGY